MVFLGKNARLTRVFPHFGRSVRQALLSLTLIAVPAAVVAQDARVPYGSPLNPGLGSGGSSQLEGLVQPIAPLPPMEKIQPVQINGADPALPANGGKDGLPTPKLKSPAPANEFGKYIENRIGRPLPRFGSNLMLPSNRDFAVPATATVPPDYILNVGDVVSISLTGSTEGSVDREIDTDGKIFLPKIGAIHLAGVRYADLKERISRAVGTEYRGYNVTVGIRQLRGIRVYVTGYANNPGAFTVSSLSTLVNAVFAAGGPSSGGSFRSIKLYRHGELVSDFDLYKLLRGGDRTGDAVLLNEDVLVIPAVGQEVAIAGSVNEEAIYEAKPGESVAALLAYAGGRNVLADNSRVMLFRPQDPDQDSGRQISAAEESRTDVKGGDLILVLSQGTLIRPLARDSLLVRIEGEVDKPGNYYVPANATLDQIVAQAGGVTARGYVFGTRIERVSVRKQQREGFKEAIQQLELSLAAAPLTSGQTLDAGERAAQLASARAVLERLRMAEPDGRIVLDISPTATAVPTNLVLENGDQIVIPPRITSVGVFGAVYRPASFLFDVANPPSVGAYIDRAGGPIRAADKGGIFVVRANGSVLSKRNGALKAHVLPGDVIFVPVKAQYTSVWARIREISTIIFQLGVSAATIKTITE